MAPCYILQIFLWVTVQNQIDIAQRVVVNKVIQLRPLRHGHVQRILDPGAVNGNLSPIPEQQFHATGVHVELANAFIVLHNRVLLKSCVAYVGQSMISDFIFHGHLHGTCRGEAPPSCLRKTALPLKSPTGAFIAAQPRHSHFRRKQKIRTLLLSRKGSDFHCLVRWKGLEPPAY